MKKLVLVAILICIFVASMPVYAIVVCHDYTMFRLTGVDPGGGTSAGSLREYLKKHGYKMYPVSNAISNPNFDRVLKPGFVIIVGNDHSGIINDSGKIDHFLQDPNHVGKPYKVTKNDISKLPVGPITSPRSSAVGGLFIGDTMAQFMNRHTGNKEGLSVEVWRK